MNRIATGACCIGLLLAGLTPAASPPTGELARVVEGFQGWLDATRDLEARFEQTLVSGALGSGMVERGRVVLRRPGRMRWDYLEPERKVAVIDGDATLLYIEEERQLWEGTLEDGALLALLLTGSRPVDAVFESSLEATSPDEHGAYRLRLVPREDADSFRHVDLLLRSPQFAVEAAEVLDGSGNLMRYRFHDLRRNRGVKEARFRFEPPPGTEILRP